MGPDLKELRALGAGHAFQARMGQLAEKAGQADDAAVETLALMLTECRGAWKENTHWCAGAVHALARAGTDRTLSLFLEYVRNLPTTVPYGVVELLALLLPGFGTRAAGTAVVLSRLPKDTAARAVGIQALCNLLTEGLLGRSEVEELQNIVNRFEPDSFYTLELVDLIRSRLKPESSVDVDMEDFLVLSE